MREWRVEIMERGVEMEEGMVEEDALGIENWDLGSGVEYEY